MCYFGQSGQSGNSDMELLKENQIEGTNHTDKYMVKIFQVDEVIIAMAMRQENIHCVQEVARRSAGQEQISQQDCGW